MEKNIKVYSNKYNEEQNALSLIFFKPEIIDNYYDNPKYKVFFDGTRGYIYMKDKYVQDDDECEYIQDFGLAYNKNNPLDRAIGVYLTDLKDLPEKVQLSWYSKEVENQKDYIINRVFYGQTLESKWSDKIPIYYALLDEMKMINNMCEKMEINKIFKKLYELEDEQLVDFRVVLSPTLNNYNKFIMTLEKLLINNIDKKTFTNKYSGFIGISELKNEDGVEKGSLSLFEEWLSLNIDTPNNLKKDIIDPLKSIRKKRQKPAHDLYENEYDNKYIEMQQEAILKVYTAIRNIRGVFSNHPKCKDIEIPEYLIDETGIINI